MAITSSKSRGIRNYLHQGDLELIDGILLHVTPRVCRKRDISNSVNIIPNSEDLFDKMFDEMKYLKCDDQPISGVTVYKADLESIKNVRKYGMKETLHVCYGKLKWVKI